MYIFSSPLFCSVLPPRGHSLARKALLLFSVWSTPAMPAGLPEPSPEILRWLPQISEHFPSWTFLSSSPLAFYSFNYSSKQVWIPCCEVIVADVKPRSRIRQLSSWISCLFQEAEFLRVRSTVGSWPAARGLALVGPSGNAWMPKLDSACWTVSLLAPSHWPWKNVAHCTKGQVGGRGLDPPRIGSQVIIQLLLV